MRRVADLRATTEYRTDLGADDYSADLGTVAETDHAAAYVCRHPAADAAAGLVPDEVAYDATPRRWRRRR